jgi:hypothetical protein
VISATKSLRSRFNAQLTFLKCTIESKGSSVTSAKSIFLGRCREISTLRRSMKSLRCTSVIFADRYLEPWITWKSIKRASTLKMTMKTRLSGFLLTKCQTKRRSIICKNQYNFTKFIFSFTIGLNQFHLRICL